MSDHNESQSSSAPVVPTKKFAAQERTDEFLKKLFANGAHFEECFCKVCDVGCPREEFGPLLWATCTLMPWQADPLVSGVKLSKAQLKSLPKRLRALADVIEELNETPLAPGNEVKIMP
jgi:hypothetical protein